MARYLVAVHHPDDFVPAAESAETRRNISTLNEEMIAAGIRLFVGGLCSASAAKSLSTGPDGTVEVADGPYLKTGEHIGGFWVLEAADMEEALAWGRRAAVACEAPIEVRQFH